MLINEYSDSFQLTTSHRGRRVEHEVKRLDDYFNSLPHTEVDRSDHVRQAPPRHFNSLPHTEVDDF